MQSSPNWNKSLSPVPCDVNNVDTMLIRLRLGDEPRALLIPFVIIKGRLVALNPGLPACSPSWAGLPVACLQLFLSGGLEARGVSRGWSY